MRWFLWKQNPLILLFHLSALICALCSSPMIIRRSWKCCHDPAQWRLYFASHSKNGWACCALLGNRILLNKTITATATSLYSSCIAILDPDFNGPWWSGFFFQTLSARWVWMTWAISMRRSKCLKSSFVELLLMDKILHHLGCIKPYK